MYQQTEVEIPRPKIEVHLLTVEGNRHDIARRAFKYLSRPTV